MVFILRKINHYDNCGHIYVHELAKSQQKDSTNSTITNNKKQRRRRSKTPQHDTSSSAAAQQHTSQTTPFHALSVVSSLHPELNSTGINDLRKLHTRSLTSNTTATTSTRGDSSTTADFNRHDIGSISSSRASSMAISDLDSHSVLSFNYYGIENRRVTFKDAMRPSSSSSASSSNNSVASAASDSVATNHRKRGKHPVYEIDNTSFHEEELMAANPYSSDLRHLSLDTNSSKNSKGFLTNLFKTKSRSKFELEIIRQQKNRDKHFQSMIGLLAQLRAVCKVVLEISNDLLGDVNRIGNRIVSLNHRVEASKRKTLFHVTHILTTAEKDATSSFHSKQHDIKFRYNNHFIMSIAATRKNSGIETDACTVHQRAVDLLHEVKSRKVSNATTTQDNQASAEKSMTENLNIRESSFSLSVLKPSNSISRSTTEPIREWLSPTQSTTNMVGPMKPPLSFEKLLTLPEPLQHRYEKRCHKDPVFHPKADAQLIKITTSSTTFKDLQNRKSTPFCSYLHDIDVLKWIHEGHVTKCSQLVSFPDFFRLKWQEQLEQKSRHQQHLTTPRGRPTSCSISSLSSAVDDSYPHHHHHYSEGMDEEYHVDILDARSSRAKPILLEKKPMRIPRWATMESVFTKYGRDTVGAEFDDDDLASCTSNTASLTRSSTSSSNYFYPHQKQHPYYVGSSSTTSTTTSNDSTYNTSTSSNLDSCEDWNYGREARHHGHHTKDKKTNKRFSLRLFGHSKNQKNHPFHEKKSKEMVELIQNQVYGHIARSLEWQHKNHSISSSHNEDYDDDESSYSSTSIMHINDVYNSRKESRRRFLNALRNYQNSKDLLNKLNTRRYSYDSASSSSSDSSDDEDISSDTCSVVRIPIAGTPQSRQPRPSSIETTVSALSMDFSSFASHPQASHLMNTMENHHDTKSNRNFLSPPPSLPQNHNIILNNQYAGHSPYTPSSNPSQSLDSLESSASETETDTSNMGELPPIFETLHEAALKKNRTLHAENHRTLDAVPNIKRMEEVNTMTTEIMDASNPSLNVESERSIVSSKKEPHLVVGEHTRRIVENLNRHDQHSSASTEPSSSFSSTTSSSLHSSDIGNNNNNSSSSSFSPNVVVVKQILSQEPIRMEPHPSRRGVVCNADEEDLQILNSLRKQCLPSNTFSQQQDHEQTTEEDDNNHDNMSNTTGSVAYSFGPITSLTKQVLSEEKLFERVQRSKPLIQIHLTNSQLNKGGKQKIGKHDNNHPMLKKEMKQDEYREEDDNCKDEEYDEYGEYEDDEEEYSTTDDDNEEEDEEEHSSSNHPTSQKFAIPSLFSLVRGKNKSSNNTTSHTTSHTNQLDQSSASHSKKNDNNNSKGAMSNLTSNNLTNSNKEIHPSTTTAAAIVNNHASASVRSNTAPSTSKLDEHSEISNTSKSSNLATNNNVTTNLPPSSSQLPTILRTSMIPVSSTQQQNVAQNTAASEPQQQPQHHTPAAHPSEPQKTMFQENISQFRRSTNHSSSYSTTSSLSSIDDYVINSMVGTNHSNRNVLKQAAKTIPQKGNTPSPLFVSNLSSSYEYSMKLMELERQQSNNPIKRIMNMKYGEYSLSDDEDEETSDEDSIYGKGHGVSAADDKVYRVAESHQSRYIPSDDESLMFDEEADDDDFDF